MRRAVAVGLVSGSLALGGPAAAQGDSSREPFAEVDPYTRGEAAALARAGYVSFGPFQFGDDRTSDHLVRELGGIPLIFVETAHFRLGSALPEYVSGDREERKRLADELERLGERLPRVKPKTKTLDPWLRLHLYAQRLEELYADFAERFDVGDGPGPGPYLGMRGKFVVLLLQKESDFARYGTLAFGQPFATSVTIQYFPQSDAMFFGTCAEFFHGSYDNDSALACGVLSGVVQNLATGYEGFRRLLPLFFTEGVAHWFSRRFDDRWHTFSGTDPARGDAREQREWEPSVRARVANEVFPPTEEMLAWDDPDALKWADHLILWSRLDFLLARDDGSAGRLLRLLSVPSRNGEVAADLEGTRRAWIEATGLRPDEFDEAWGAWVLARYARR